MTAAWAHRSARLAAGMEAARIATSRLLEDNNIGVRPGEGKDHVVLFRHGVQELAVAASGAGSSAEIARLVPTVPEFNHVARWFRASLSALRVPSRGQLDAFDAMAGELQPIVASEDASAAAVAKLLGIRQPRRLDGVRLHQDLRSELEEDQSDDDGLLEYHTILLQALDGQFWMGCCPRVRRDRDDRAAPFLSPVIFLLLGSVLFCATIQSFIAQWEQNAAVARIKPDSAADLASPGSIALYHVPRMVAAVGTIGLAIVRIMNGETVFLTEAIGAAGANCLGFGIAMTLRQSPLLGVVCHGFAGTAMTAPVLISICIALVAMLKRRYPLLLIAFLALVGGILTSNALYGTYLMHVLGGHSHY